MINVTLGQRIQTLMDEKDMNQKQLAVELNLPASTVRNYVRDLREPDYETLKLFARFFGVSTDYLLGYSKFDAAMEEYELEIFRIFRALTPEQRHIFIQQGKVFVTANTKKATSSIGTSAKDKAAG